MYNVHDRAPFIVGAKSPTVLYIRSVRPAATLAPRLPGLTFDGLSRTFCVRDGVRWSVVLGWRSPNDDLSVVRCSDWCDDCLPCLALARPATGQNARPYTPFHCYLGSSACCSAGSLHIYS